MNSTTSAPAGFPIVAAEPGHFDRALPSLVELLQACVAAGASIGWPATPDADTAAAFWRGCIAATAAGDRGFWWVLARDGDPSSVVASAQLAWASMPNGRHRAEVMKVMVHPLVRRRGLAAALLRRLETEALARGRWLLVLDTLSGSDAERLYARLGWQSSGRIPAYAEVGDGRFESTTVMFKPLRP